MIAATPHHTVEIGPVKVTSTTKTPEQLARIASKLAKEHWPQKPKETLQEPPIDSYGETFVSFMAGKCSPQLFTSKELRSCAKEFLQYPNSPVIRGFFIPALTVIEAKEHGTVVTYQPDEKAWKRVLPRLLKGVATSRIERAVIHVSGQAADDVKQTMAEQVLQRLPEVPTKIVLTKRTANDLLVELLLAGVNVQREPPSLNDDRKGEEV